jgi:hypothetical protein
MAPVPEEQLSLGIAAHQKLSIWGEIHLHAQSFFPFLAVILPGPERGGAIIQNKPPVIVTLFGYIAQGSICSPLPEGMSTSADAINLCRCMFFDFF